MNSAKLKTVFLAAFAFGLLTACGKSGPTDTAPSVAPLSSPTHLSLADSHGWMLYFPDNVPVALRPTIAPQGQGFQVTNNVGLPGSWAAIAWNFANPLDTSIPYQVTFRVQGVNGAKNMGLAFALTGQDPTPDNPNLQNEVIPLTGQVQTITVNLPQTAANSKVGLAQMAIHFGYDFGNNNDPLKNPAGSGIVVLDAHVDQIGAQAAAISQSTSLQEAQPLAPANAAIVSPSNGQTASIGSVITGSQAPAVYTPAFTGTASVNPEAYQNFQRSNELIQQAGQTAASKPAQAVSDAQTAGTLSHPVNAVAAK